MPTTISIANREIGGSNPAYFIAEIGINHNGDINIAKKLIDAASISGCEAVKFQKRTPELCVPKEQRDVMRETPWGTMSYLEYRERVEFGEKEYSEIDRYCREKDIRWFASCWDKPSVDFIEKFSPPCYKIASASLTDDDLLKHHVKTGRLMILSTGMSSIEQIRHAVSVCGESNLLIAHSTSTYPCKPENLNLRMIQTLNSIFDCPVGYSGHEVGLQTTYAAVTLGASFVERHITIDRSMWGSDQAASVETSGFIRLVRDTRYIEKAIGDGVKKVYADEIPLIKRLRKRTNIL